MRSRELKKRIDIYSNGTSLDGFGGSVSTQTLIATTWAKLETLSPGSIVHQFGDKIPERSVRVTMRKRIDLDLTGVGNFIKYKNKEYQINGGIIDTNFTGKFITFTMSELPTRST